MVLIHTQIITARGPPTVSQLFLGVPWASCVPRVMLWFPMLRASVLLGPAVLNGGYCSRGSWLWGQEHAVRPKGLVPGASALALQLEPGSTPEAGGQPVPPPDAGCPEGPCWVTSPSFDAPPASLCPEGPGCHQRTLGAAQLGYRTRSS